MSVVFAAKYHGKCAGGCSGIHPGDEVTYADDNALMHTDCENSEGLRETEEQIELREPEHPTCTSCFLIHRPGVCDL